MYVDSINTQTVETVMSRRPTTQSAALTKSFITVRWTVRRAQWMLVNFFFQKLQHFLNGPKAKWSWWQGWKLWMGSTSWPNTPLPTVTWQVLLLSA